MKGIALILCLFMVSCGRQEPPKDEAAHVPAARVFPRQDTEVNSRHRRREDAQPDGPLRQRAPEDRSGYIARALTNIALFKRMLALEANVIPVNVRAMSLEEAEQLVQRDLSPEETRMLTDRVKCQCVEDEAAYYLFSNLYEKALSQEGLAEEVGCFWGVHAMRRKDMDYAISIFKRTISDTDDPVHTCMLKYMSALASHLKGDHEETERVLRDAYAGLQEHKQENADLRTVESCILRFYVESLHNAGKHDEAMALINTLNENGDAALKQLWDGFTDSIKNKGTGIFQTTLPRLE